MQTIKCVVIGDEKIGKTCMLTTHTYNYYPGDNASEVFADIFSSTIDIGDERQIKLSFWDTAEQEDYYNDYFSPTSSDVILICFSVMNCKSFRNVELNWHPEVRKFCPSAKVILVGNKIDMRINDEAAMNKLKSLSNEKPVTYYEGLKMAKKINALQYLECSALTRVGLAQVFDAVVKSVVLPLQIENKNSGGVKRSCESKEGVSDSSPAKYKKSESD